MCGKVGGRGNEFFLGLADSRIAILENFIRLERGLGPFECFGQGFPREKERQRPRKSPIQTAIGADDAYSPGDFVPEISERDQIGEGTRGEYEDGHARHRVHARSVEPAD